MVNKETEQEKAERIKKLKADFEQWVKYYFPDECNHEPAAFHKAATERVINNPEWTEVRMWSRELAVTTRTVQEVRFLVLTKRKKSVLVVSHTAEAAKKVADQITRMHKNVRIATDYTIELLQYEIDYGGVGQSFCGVRRSPDRYDVVLYMDMDTDSNCEEQYLIEKRWNWINFNIIPQGSLSKLLTIWCGQRRAANCCITKAAFYAEFVQVVNITDQDGRSVWPERNSDEHIQRLFSTMSEKTIQREFYNNPI